MNTDNRKRKHNAPIASVIQDYIDKKSGRVVASRKEIVRRFDGLDWECQRQILFAFLESGSMDRAWAYSQLFAHWDDCFIPVIQEQWEKSQEETLTRLIIRHFPVSFLRENIERLGEKRNYAFLCQRLHGEVGFIVDETRLNELDLLKMRVRSGRRVTCDDARDMFFLLIYKFCKGVYGYRAWGSNWGGMDDTMEMLKRPIVKNMLSEIMYLGMGWGHELNQELHEWIRNVSADFRKKSSVSCKESWVTDEEEAALREAEKSHCHEHIPSRYTSIWDTYDCNMQRLFLNDLEIRHEMRDVFSVDDRKKDISFGKTMEQF